MNENKLGKKPDAAVQRELAHPLVEMDLETARKILEQIVGTSELSIESLERIETFAGIDVNNIRQAVHVVALSLVDKEMEVRLRTNAKNNNSPFIEGQVFKEKEAPPYRLTLQTLRENRHGNSGEVDALIMWADERLEDYETKRYEFQFPLKDESENVASFSGSPGNPGGFFGVNLSIISSRTLSDDPLGDYRVLIKGLRWASANLLEWNTNPNIVLPEDLDARIQSSKAV